MCQVRVSIESALRGASGGFMVSWFAKVTKQVLEPECVPCGLPLRVDFDDRVGSSAVCPSCRSRKYLPLAEILWN